MADTPSSVVPVTSGPVPPVSARYGSSLPGSQDCDPFLRQPGWPPSSSSPGGALRGLPGPCRVWPVGLFKISHAAYRCSPSLCVGDDDDNWQSSSTPFPTYEDSSWRLQNQVQASRIRMPLPASFYAAPPSPWVWPRRGSAVTTSGVRAFQPAPPPAALAGLPGPTGRFRGPFPGGPTPVPPPVFPSLPDSEMHSPTPPPCFRGVFWVPRPLLSSRPGTLYHQPPQVSPLWLPRWHNQMLWTLHRALPRTWSRAGWSRAARDEI